MDVDLADITDSEDPRIAEAADQIITGLRALMDELGVDVAAALYDAVADRLDTLIEQAEARLDAEDEEDDEELLEVEDEPDEV